MSAPAPLFVDKTHCGRHVTGLERITLELFSREALAPLAPRDVTARRAAEMVARQTVQLPWLALANPRALVLCPGFPPSPLLSAFGGRVLPYIHDLFLMTRWADLNPRAKLYMAGPFRLAVKRLPRFLVNSEHTRDALREHARPDAEVDLYRPRVRNVFGLEVGDRATRTADPGALRLVALGTVEPRKNLKAAAALVGALRAGPLPGATLDVVGREGWGEDMAALRAAPGVTLHGYQPIGTVRAIVEAADALLTTSHDEGLGLPLLEAQYAGLLVVAPDKRVFREVLGASGLTHDMADVAGAAARLAAEVAAPDWRARHAALARENLARWNALADADRVAVVSRVAGLIGREL